ncbi:hypothetical protein V5799_031013 [Amblyomma americanum]|uniref:Uncharacterized protein n=1 Tax=Amblyomma americanum TaxID=6943 RepID=A0AAQ4ELQ3_AMBAM
MLAVPVHVWFPREVVVALSSAARSALSQSSPQKTRKTLARGSEARARRRRSVPRFAVRSGPRNGLLQREARPGGEEAQAALGPAVQAAQGGRLPGGVLDGNRRRAGRDRRRSTLNAAAPADVKQEQPGEDAETREAAAVAATAAPPQPWPLAMRPAAVLPHHLAAQELSSDPEELFCLSLAARLKRLRPANEASPG